MTDKIVKLREVGGVICADSLDIARDFHKEHRNVIRDIDGHVEAVAKLPPTRSNLSASNWFRLDSYFDSKQEKRRRYDMTEEGFALVVGRYSGKAALEWQIAYHVAFQDMKAKLGRPGARESFELFEPRKEIEQRDNVVALPPRPQADLFNLPEVTPPPSTKRPTEFCRDEWFRLPLALRQRWWRETEYGKRPPTEALVADCKRALERALHTKLQPSLDLVAEPDYDADIEAEDEGDRDQWQIGDLDLVARTQYGRSFLRIMLTSAVDTLPVPRLNHMFYLPTTPQLAVMFYGVDVPSEVVRAALVRKGWDTPLVLATLKNLLDT